MHEIRDLMHGFTVSQVTNNVVYERLKYIYINLVLTDKRSEGHSLTLDELVGEAYHGV